MRQLQQRDIKDLRHQLNKQQKEYYKRNPCEEMWFNEKYIVHVRRGEETEWNNKDGTPILITHLSIRRDDKRAIIDWRDFQWIKNQLVGEENEGCELYPAESRLVDGANQFHIWVFEDSSIRFPFGFQERVVSEKNFAGETQRKFPQSRIPSDLKESEEKLKSFWEQYMKNEN